MNERRLLNPSEAATRNPVKALRRTEVAGFESAAIHDDLLQDDTGIHNPELQRVDTRGRDQMAVWL